VALAIVKQRYKTTDIYALSCQSNNCSNNTPLFFNIFCREWSVHFNIKNKNCLIERLSRDENVIYSKNNGYDNLTHIYKHNTDTIRIIYVLLVFVLFLSFLSLFYSTNSSVSHLPHPSSNCRSSHSHPYTISVHHHSPVTTTIPLLKSAFRHRHHHPSTFFSDPSLTHRHHRTHHHRHRRRALTGNHLLLLRSDHHPRAPSPPPHTTSTSSITTAIKPLRLPLHCTGSERSHGT